MQASTPLGDGTIPRDEQRRAASMPRGRRPPARRRRRSARRAASQRLARALPRPREVRGVGLDDDDLEAREPERLGVDPGEAELEHPAAAARRAARGSAASRSPRARAGASLLAEDGDRPDAEGSHAERDQRRHAAGRLPQRDGDRLLDPEERRAGEGEGPATSNVRTVPNCGVLA